ncbi:hypothetical protein HFO32_23055 [Rhizobium leguminosarum]|uniref:ATP-binding protein n=1 Tax=Rhizobium leguminosarum TaxID=384 RepID=UPI001C939AEF|nr:winged helix-turn-helix domain-containing protein [Rhizobium leguminosarum]MBY5652632.1 hypothetical protein [Rhizobium leguminosarum]MBY5672302.1 hypothetical protein [Rhizobium leguminosarum]MBY5684988.1 hypothetical protein [Rhizobium leguminosarum]MBY5707802.1 hypothetical protein [Rhizobium leguminosarum]
MSTPDAVFGPFRFNRVRRVLIKGEVPVQLGARALAILSALIETPGQLVTKRELFEKAWPGLTVDEANLKVQISGLRKALGDEGNFIRAEASLGYRFIGDIAFGHRSNEASERRRFRAPQNLTTPIGRDEVTSNICDLLNKNRLVTILGTGGIGKTTVALAVARKLAESYADGICFVDLGRIVHQDQVIAAIKGALDLHDGEEASIEQILLGIHRRQLLLILDCCEHVIENVAQLAERVLAETTNIQILVTSRESLRVAGEVVWRLEPLEIPPLSLQGAASDIDGYSSVQLFMRTVRQTIGDFLITDESAISVAEICRRLDGIPLALELAASVVNILGIAEIRRGLDQRFALLDLDRRAVIPRHRSMGATIDWSYNQLSPRLQAVIRRLACFAGPFTLDAASSVAPGEGMNAQSVPNAIVELVNKSLLSLNHQADPHEYRLLETTKAYASQAQGPFGEGQLARENHARYFLSLLEQQNWDDYEPVLGRAKMQGCLEEIRAALDWAFEFNGALAVRLTLAAERLWLELTSLSQSIHYLGLAMREVNADPDADAALRARVLVSYVSSQSHILISGVDEGSLVEQAWRAAQAAQDEFLQLRALYAFIDYLNFARRPLQYELDEFSVLAAKSDDPAIQQLPLLISGYYDVEHSDIVSSVNKLETFVANCVYFPRKYYLYFGNSLTLYSEVTVSLMRYWLGYCEQARTALAVLVESAEYRANSSTLCFVLAHGALLCELRSGDVDIASDYLQKLEQIAAFYKPWNVLVVCYRAILTKEEYKKQIVSVSDLRAAEQSLGKELKTEPFLKKQGGLFPILLFELAETRLILRDFEGVLETLQEAMTYCTNDQDARIIGEHERILAQTLVARNEPGDLEAAGVHFRRSIEVARFRSLYLYEFEATLGLAELELATGRPIVAGELVTQLLDRLADRDQLPGMARAQDILHHASLAGTRELRDTPGQAGA